MELRLQRCLRVIMSVEFSVDGQFIVFCLFEVFLWDKTKLSLCWEVLFFSHQHGDANYAFHTYSLIQINIFAYQLKIVSEHDKRWCSVVLIHWRLEYSEGTMYTTRSYMENKCLPWDAQIIPRSWIIVITPIAWPIMYCYVNLFIFC